MIEGGHQVEDSSSFWSAAQVYASQEHRAVINLERQGFTSFYPSFLERVPGLALPKIRPLFPGYVFIEMQQGDPWAAINSTYGVIRLLVDRGSRSGADPQRVPDEFIVSMGRCLRPNPDGRGMLAEGTRIRVLRGMLEDREAVVKWSRDERLGLLFMLFQRQVEIELFLGDVEVLK